MKFQTGETSMGFAAFAETHSTEGDCHEALFRSRYPQALNTQEIVVFFEDRALDVPPFTAERTLHTRGAGDTTMPGLYKRAMAKGLQNQPMYAKTFRATRSRNPLP